MACISHKVDGGVITYCTPPLMGWDFSEKTAKRRKQALIHNIKRDIESMEHKPKQKAKDLALARQYLAQLEREHKIGEDGDNPL